MPPTVPMGGPLAGREWWPRGGVNLRRSAGYRVQYSARSRPRRAWPTLPRRPARCDPLVHPQGRHGRHVPGPVVAPDGNGRLSTAPGCGTRGTTATPTPAIRCPPGSRPSIAAAGRCARPRRAGSGPGCSRWHWARYRSTVIRFRSTYSPRRAATRAVSGRPWHPPRSGSHQPSGACSAGVSKPGTKPAPRGSRPLAAHL